MPHIITSLCLRDSACVEVCPVDCIIPGKPAKEWPWFYIDPDTCIDCGVCVPECPYDAIFFDEEVPSEIEMSQDQRRNLHNVKGVITYDGGELVDLTSDISKNNEFFNTGPGYNAINM